MVDIIYDMTLINVAKGVNKSILENNGIIPEQYLFNKHSPQVVPSWPGPTRNKP